MKKNLTLLIILTLTFCCSKPTNKEIALDFFNSELEGNTKKYSELLDDRVTGFFIDSPDTVKKNDFIENRKFSKPWNSWVEITSIEDTSDSTVQLHMLETNDLQYYFGIDTIGYRYSLTISNSKITNIFMDTIPNSGFNYREVDSLYNHRLAELFDWMSLWYPEEYEQIESLDEQSASVILEMAKLKREEEDSKR